MKTTELLQLSREQLADRAASQLEKARADKHKAFITLADSAAAGYSLAVKDNLCVRGMRCTSSSRVLEDWVAPYDATVVARCRGEFSVIGKTAHDAFGAGSAGVNCDFGAPVNPVDGKRVPGGSSSGNAVALALGLCDFALGTDTFGSVRAPAAFCGVVGLRPTYGLVSRHGLLDLSMSLDTVGPMARDVDGVALLLSRIGGADPRDATSLHSKPRDYARKTGLRGARVGVLTGVETDSAVSKAFDDTVEKIKSAGARVEEVDFGGLGASVPAYYLLMFAEFASAMQRYQGLGFGGPRSLLGRELKRRVLLGTYVSLAEHRQKWYSLALRGKAFVRARVEALLSRHDFLLSPTMPSLPWRLGEKSSPLEEYSMDVLTGFAALAGVPAISFPAGKMVGMQLVAGRFEEARLLSAARELEA